MSIVTDSSLALFQDSIAKAWDSLYKSDMAGAMSHAKMAATIGPDLPETFHILGLLASRDGRSDIALPLLEKALAIEATERRYRDIAEAYIVAGEAELALTNLLHALREFGSSAELCGLLVAVYVALDQYDTAAAYAKEAIALKPHLMAWEGSLGFCHLIQGDYTNGFEIYTGRSQNLAAGSRCPVLHFTKPGELWLKNEQGPGDTLFYARFAKPLADAGWRIHLQTDKKTKVLLRDTGVFVSVKEAITPPLNAFWLNMGDLPLAAIQTGSIETPPPLALMADQSRIRKVREKLSQIGPAPYIAVTWRAGARGAKQRAGLRMYDKVASPKELGKLLSNINATVISIQRVPDDQEQSEFATALGRDFINFSYYNDNLQDMLALLSVVDEYVTVPNTNVHLRESLNLSAQVLVNRPYQDWRWLAEGSTSPWYPNSKIYRQGINQDWGSTFTEIGIVLDEKFGSLNSNSAQSDISRLQIAQNEVDHLLQKGWGAVNTGDIPAAIQAAQSVIKISAAASPMHENVEALHLLGWAALHDSKYDLAINILQRAAEISQIDGRIIGDYVRALSAGKRHDEAIKIASDAISNSAVKNISSIYFSRAAAFLKLNQLENAIADYEACIRINPNRLDAQEYCGMARLKLGDTMRGFRDYTARKVAKRDELINDWCCPRLTKEHRNLHVLIKRDMGLGDELTFLRYLPWLTEAGIKVDYWSGKKLVPILERTGYFNQVLSDADPAPDRTQYDISFIVNELPVAVESLGVPLVAPPLPLTPKPELVEKWRKWLKSIGNGPYIGINWRAGAANEDVARNRGKLNKAVDADAFALTLSVVNATWVSLQRNIVLDELRRFEKMLNATVHDAAALTDDLEDLLALLSLLDENIGVSNTNMHLRAGLGLGSKVLVQTPGGDWRWGYQGNQSSWFIESKIYRQNISEDWSGALNELQSDLVAAYGNKADGDHVATYQSHFNISSKRLIWLTAGVIKNGGGNKTSTLASARYRVLAPALELEKSGWSSEFVNEAYAQAMGGWGSNVPQKGDTVIISKVFTDFSAKLAQDAKNRGATVIADFCDNFLAHPQRGPLQHALLAIADKVTASTPAMAEAIQAAGKNVDAIIADPVEFKRGEIRFSPWKILKLVWFGHAVNIDTLAQSLPALAQLAKTIPLELNVVTILPNGQQDLKKITPQGLTTTYIPWSVSATEAAIADCDIVIIPTLQNDIKNAKSPNRLLEPLWAGRMVVAGPQFAYLPFGDSAWVGENLLEGIQWCVRHPDKVLVRIKQGQLNIAAYFTIQAIAEQWNKVFTPEEALLTHLDAAPLLQDNSPLEPYFQAKEAARILGLNNQTESQIKQTYFSHYAKNQVPQASKIGVYTAIFGGYDTAPILNYVDPNIDYILYTDQADFNAPSPWQVRVVPAIFKDPQVNARRIKILSHLFLADYDITVWIDGNFTLEKLTVELVQDIASRAPVALCKHQFRNCIYEEAIEILKRSIDASSPVLKQMQCYQSRQFPAQFGLHATAFLLRNHNDSHTIKMNMRWWELLSTNSKRDQLSFDYVRWEANISVMTLPFNQRENQLFEWGKNGERKHKVNVRRNDEHQGRSLNYEAVCISRLTEHEYKPEFDCWHKKFLQDINNLNQTLISAEGALRPSILYATQTAICAQSLPDVRLGNLQRETLSRIVQAKHILQIGFDGGHLSLLAIHHSGAKCVLVDEYIDQYKRTGLIYLTQHHSKRFAIFSSEDVTKLDDKVFDLVFVFSNNFPEYEALIQKVQSFNNHIVFLPSNEVFLNEPIQSNANNTIDKSTYTMSVYDVWLKNRKGDLTWRFAIEGKYGFYFSDWLKKQSKSIFIDIGANIGLYSLIANKNPEIEATYSFEPHPETYQYLLDNITANNATKCVAYQLAISDKSEIKEIHTKPNHSGVATLREIKAVEGYESSVEIECIDAFHLSTLVKNPDNLPISIKIDVEGFELVVIQTLIKTSFWTHVTNIYYEVDENYLDYKKLETILLEQGFRFEAKNGDGSHYDLLFVRN